MLRRQLCFSFEMLLRNYGKSRTCRACSSPPDVLVLGGKPLIVLLTSAAQPVNLNRVASSLPSPSLGATFRLR